MSSLFLMEPNGRLSTNIKKMTNYPHIPFSFHPVCNYFSILFPPPHLLTHHGNFTKTLHLFLLLFCFIWLRQHLIDTITIGFDKWIIKKFHYYIVKTFRIAQSIIHVGHFRDNNQETIWQCFHYFHCCGRRCCRVKVAGKDKRRNV